jgi:hypothetical protein
MRRLVPAVRRKLRAADVTNVLSGLFILRGVPAHVTPLHAGGEGPPATGMVRTPQSTAGTWRRRPVLAAPSYPYGARRAMRT